MDNEVTFEIKEKIGVIDTYSTGWSKEINPVSWNGCPAKYDIRDWDPDHEHMSRGITLTEKQMKKIMELVKEKEPKDKAAKDSVKKNKPERDMER